MENDFSRVIDALPALFWTAHPDGTIDFHNRRWYEFTGLAETETPNVQWHSAIHPGDLTELLEKWKGIVLSGDSGEIKIRIRRLDGQYRMFLLRMCPVLSTLGDPPRWCGISTDIENHKLLYPALAEGEDRFRLIVDGLPAVVTLMTAEGHIYHANRHMLEYLGVADNDEMKTRLDGHAFHPDDRPKVLEKWKNSVNTGEPYDHEARLRRADGVYRWFHTQGFPLRNADDEIVLWYMLQTDVEDRKQAEALLEGEKRLLELVAGGHPMSIVLESLCHLVEATAVGSICTVILVDPECSYLQQVIAPSLPASFNDSIQGREVRVDAGPCAMAACLNEQVVSPDILADPRWNELGWRPLALAHGLRACWSTPITSTNGKVLGTFALQYGEPGAPLPFHQNLIRQFIDLARIAIERVRHDAELKRSEALLAEAQQLSSTGSFSWRVSTDIVVYSEQTYRTYELDPALPVTLALIADRIHPEDIPLLKEMVDIARNVGADLDYQYRLRMPDSSIKHLHLFAHATRDGDGQVEYIGAIQDVTQRMLAEDSLSKARADLAHVSRVSSLGVLTASIAHEVNQPLSGIITNASTCLRMLAADPPNIDGALETARRTIRDGQRASDVIAKLRAAFSRKSSCIEAVDLNEAARGVIALSLSDIQRSGITLRTNFPRNLPAVAGGRVQIQQVILNLLLNALDAVRQVENRQKIVTVRTRIGQDSFVELEVEDTGVGVDAETLDKMFDAFFTTKPEGMGIGLSVSRSIIQSYHGRLSAKKNETVGTTFTFSIPCLSNVLDTAAAGALEVPVTTDSRH